MIHLLHIRSADKISETEILAASDYLRYLEKICVLHCQDFKSCAINTHCWVVTDSYHNVAEFIRSSKDDFRKKFRKSTLSENSFDHKNFSYYRYSQRSAIQFFQELRLLVDSELAIGMFTSNFFMYVFEAKSANNQFLSDSTFSIDAILYNTIPSMTPHIYYVIDCKYVIPLE